MLPFLVLSPLSLPLSPPFPAFPSVPLGTPPPPVCSHISIHSHLRLLPPIHPRGFSFCSCYFSVIALPSMASSVVAHLPGSLTLALLEPAFATPTAAPRCTSWSPSFCPLLPSKPNVGSSAVSTRLLCSNLHSSAALWQNRSSWQAVCKSASPSQQVVEEQDGTEDDMVPTPVVVIDQDSDPEATVVELSFGDRLGGLLDTMKALKDLGLNVVKSRISVEGPITRKRFSITRIDTGRKVDDPELMEAIRLTIINNMLKYHPESSVQLAMGNAFGIKPPTKQLDIDIATHIYIYDDGPHRSLLCIETADRPGLLMEIVKVIKDVSISFESGEFDTEGLVAKAKFHVNYRGAALSKPLQEVLRNCLRYFLRRPETNEDSY